MFSTIFLEIQLNNEKTNKFSLKCFSIDIKYFTSKQTNLSICVPFKGVL